MDSAYDAPNVKVRVRFPPGVLMETRKCCECKKTKPIDQFSFKRKADNLHHSACKTCFRKRMRTEYRKNKFYYTNKANIRRRELSKKLLEFLNGKSCVDCGEDDLVVLDFDHARGKKDREVSNMIRDGIGWTKILKEIKKCDICCSNCHRRRTAKKFNWKRLFHSKPIIL